ncbi:hypothetical protein QAD02_009923 [Eretmocerus hayati]|uniref:Uncharacterized protein n=1 Tax=Eretmocerus hayati TaxID=131215 RepID=A0ACC2NAP9_9HYME|nr:hypothetical protein QAD02_009923 [Eretmocerus hayati]
MYVLGLTYGVVASALPLTGENVIPAENSGFPFIVSIQDEKQGGDVNQKHICTGTLISRKHILTTAHCFDDQSRLDGYQILYGSSDLRECDRYSLKSRISYKEWSKKTGKTPAFVDNDIAILTMSREISTPSFQPASLSKKNVYQFYGLIAETAGWGDMMNHESPFFLQTASLEILDHESCSQKLNLILGYAVELITPYLCSTAAPYTKISFGDSGGPIFYKGRKIIGINKGFGRSYSSNPVETNVHIALNFYRGFIRDVIEHE